MTTEAAVAEAAVLVSAYSEASEHLKESTAAVAESAWLSFQSWYSTAAVTALAVEMADLSKAAQDTAAGLTAQYAEQVAQALASVRLPLVRQAPWTQIIRNGIDAPLVHRRPDEAYKRAIATGATHQEALERAGLRARGLMFTDLTVQEQAVQQAVLDHIGITHYRRVIRPELSKTGTCGLCIAASTRTYNTGDLMPIHGNCKCVVMPIVGDNDPGVELNREDLDALYAEAGSTAARDLARTRYKVQRHGELGPVLTFVGQDFRGPDRVALEDDPERVARMLDKVLPVLASLEQRSADGESVAGPLAYQRDLVERLRRIAAA